MIESQRKRLSTVVFSMIAPELTHRDHEESVERGGAAAAAAAPVVVTLDGQDGPGALVERCSGGRWDHSATVPAHAHTSAALAAGSGRVDTVR